MELGASLVFSAFLLACAAGLLVWHVLAWRAGRRRRLDPSELEYRRRQFRRRMQTTTMLALLAASLPIGQWLVTQWPEGGVVFWGLVLFLLAWVVVLALADVWATKFYYGRLRDRNQLEQTRLKAQLWQLRERGRQIELERLRQAGSGGNGEPETPEPGPENEP